MARAKRRISFWWYLALAVVVGGLLFGALDWWVYRRAPAPDALRGLEPPLRFADVAPHEALEVVLGPGAEDASGLPQVAVRFQARTWFLAHPAPGSSLPEASAVWNRLVPVYEDMSASFAEAVEAVREREPERTVGVIRRDGEEGDIPEAVVEFVRDAFADAGVYDVVVAP